jgi:hypothetical protein
MSSMDDASLYMNTDYYPNDYVYDDDETRFAWRAAFILAGSLGLMVWRTGTVPKSLSHAINI